MNICTLTEGATFKTFSEENLVVVLGSCYLLTYLKNVEHGIKHDVLIVLMEFAYIRYSRTLQ